jgi:hypothetical protein
MKHKQAVALVTKDLRSLGNTVVPQTHSAAKGADIEMWTGRRSYKVEVKVPYKLASGGWQIDALHERNADMVAIVINKNRIIYCTIGDHAKIASPRGFRGVSHYINFFKGG